MKVLMLTPSFSPIVGGTEHVVKELAFNLNKQEILTDVMTFNMNKKWNPVWKNEIKKEDTFKVFEVAAFNPIPKMRIDPLPDLSGAHIIPKLNFTGRLRDYDILHFHDDGDLTFPVFSWFVNKPKIFQCHSLTSSYEHYKERFFAKAILGKIADAYTCPSSQSKKLLSKLGIPESKIFLLPNGVDPEKFKPNKASKIDNMLLQVGRVTRGKGLNVLLKALKYIDEPVNLKIAGPKNDNQYINELMGSNDKMNLGIHTVELLGAVNEGLVELYRQASMLVTPSLNEDFPLVNLEALSCETPVVASDVGGIGDVIKNGVNGFLVPPNDPEKLADAIRKLLKDKDLREKYGANGRQLIKEHYSWDNITKQLITIYKTLL